MDAYTGDVLERESFRAAKSQPKNRRGKDQLQSHTPLATEGACHNSQRKPATPREPQLAGRVDSDMGQVLPRFGGPQVTVEVAAVITVGTADAQ